MTTLDDAAEHLYAEGLGGFVARRRELAAAARAAGDRPGATAIAALPKPSTAAWVVNLLARERADVIDSLVSLGDSLREAQEDLDPDALRTLGEQRRRLVAQIAGQATSLAEDTGQKVGPSIRDEVEQTLQAALADAAAAAAVRTGRLTRALATNGFDAVELEGAVAGGAEMRSRPGPGGSRKSAKAADAPDDLAEARRRKQELEQRRREAKDAAGEAAAARDRAARAGTARDDARRRRDDIRSERDELRARLEEIEEQLTRASAELRSATNEFDDASDARNAADDAESRARARVDALEKGGR